MKPSSDQNKYDIKIQECFLDISTVKLEASIRGQYDNNNEIDLQKNMASPVACGGTGAVFEVNEYMGGGSEAKDCKKTKK